MSSAIWLVRRRCGAHGDSRGSPSRHARGLRREPAAAGRGHGGLHGRGPCRRLPRGETLLKSPLGLRTLLKSRLDFKEPTEIPIGF
jgi:hypothetical protein